MLFWRGFIAGGVIGAGCGGLLMVWLLREAISEAIGRAFNW